jgi:hypothetical protein
VGATHVRGLVACASAATAVVLLSACSGSSEEAVTTASEPVTTSTPEAGSKVRILQERQFLCRGRVDLDLVRVTMRRTVDDAISLDENCSGRIGRIEVDTWTADGIKVQNHGKVAHDLVIESGYVKCHDIAGEYHQDGIQVMGGRSITFRNLRVDCLGNANLGADALLRGFHPLGGARDDDLHGPLPRGSGRARSGRDGRRREPRAPAQRPILPGRDRRGGLPVSSERGRRARWA